MMDLVQSPTLFFVATEAEEALATTTFFALPIAWEKCRSRDNGGRTPKNEMHKRLDTRKKKEMRKMRNAEVFTTGVNSGFIALWFAF
jgi:hypothetical protein